MSLSILTEYRVTGPVDFRGVKVNVEAVGRAIERLKGRDGDHMPTPEELEHAARHKAHVLHSVLGYDDADFPKESAHLRRLQMCAGYLRYIMPVPVDLRAAGTPASTIQSQPVTIADRSPQVELYRRAHVMTTDKDGNVTEGYADPDDIRNNTDLARHVLRRTLLRVETELKNISYLPEVGPLLEDTSGLIMQLGLRTAN